MRKFNLFTVLLLVLSLLGQSLNVSASNSMKMSVETRQSMELSGMEHSMHAMSMNSDSSVNFEQMDCCGDDCDCPALSCSVNSCSVTGATLNNFKLLNNNLLVSQTIDLYTVPNTLSILSSPYRPPITL